MTPKDFIHKWQAADLKERSAAQEHFIDLCRLLGEPTPAEADPKGESYCFEKGASKLGGGEGWADVWKRGCFGWVWVHPAILPDKKLMVIARSDDSFFGLIHSRFHELWSLAMCTWHGVGNDPRYTPTTIFETFPFPEGLTPNIPAADYADDPRAQAIARAARRLNELRENWLNPPEWVRRAPEVVPGYPDRLLPVDEKAAVLLKKRTLTNLYNERPAWLANAHRDLDAAVAAAYGWSADLGDDQILQRLLDLNQTRRQSQQLESQPCSPSPAIS